MPAEPEVAEFFSTWSTYRAVIEHDCMEHTVVYAAVRDVLAARNEPFRLLDLGCGDAAGIKPALAASAVATYVGVDCAAPALDAASVVLADVPFAVDLRVADFMKFVTETDETFDVVVACFALHHFQADEKREFLSAVQRILAPGGQLMLIDVVRLPGETRAGYLARYADFVSTWPVGAARQASIMAHVSGFDFPEEVDTAPRWARDAGFTQVTEFYRGARDTQCGWVCTTHGSA